MEEKRARPSLPTPGVLWRVAVRAGVLVVIVIATMAACFWMTRPRPMPATEIFEGITYEVRQLDETADTGGLAHLVVDLAAPGIALYVTPTDSAAMAAGHEYITRWPPAAAKEAGTAVLINAAMFSATRGTHGLPGDFPQTAETLVSEHAANHVWEHTYLMWFEDDLTPHLERSKPPSPEVLKKARWGVGGQGITYADGKVGVWAFGPKDRRTMVGLDRSKRLLFFGVFESASQAGASLVMAEFGATEVMPLDGGTSTTLVFGEGAKGVSKGAAVLPLRALPTFFGVRARRK